MASAQEQPKEAEKPGVEKPVEEMLRKYLGISAPRVVIGILMLIFGILIFIAPDLLSILVAIYLVISGILVLIDEFMKRK